MLLIPIKGRTYLCFHWQDQSLDHSACPKAAMIQMKNVSKKCHKKVDERIACPTAATINVNQLNCYNNWLCQFQCRLTIGFVNSNVNLENLFLLSSDDRRHKDEMLLWMRGQHLIQIFNHHSDYYQFGQCSILWSLYLWRFWWSYLSLHVWRAILSLNIVC